MFFGHLSLLHCKPSFLYRRGAQRKKASGWCPISERKWLYHLRSYSSTIITPPTQECRWLPNSSAYPPCCSIALRANAGDVFCMDAHSRRVLNYVPHTVCLFYRIPHPVNKLHLASLPFRHTLATYMAWTYDAVIKGSVKVPQSRFLLQLVIFINF